MSTAITKTDDGVGLFNDLEQYLLQEWGREGRMGWGVITDFIDLGREHGKDKLYDAIKIAAQYNKRSYRYVLGILTNTKTKPLPKPDVLPGIEAKGLGFVEVVCSCTQSEVMRKIDLENNKGRMWRCVFCSTAHSVTEMLESELNGKIIIKKSMEEKS